jgi:hypothetical protein
VHFKPERFAMPLQKTKRAAVVAFGSVSFFMSDDQRTVRVDVSKELLARISGSAPKSPEDFIGRLQRHRRQFEQIAAAKFEEGLFHHEVRVLVVRIADADLTE